jgi:hypothetical protein
MPMYTHLGASSGEVRLNGFVLVAGEGAREAVGESAAAATPRTLGCRALGAAHA